MSESADKARLIAALVAARSSIEAVLLQLVEESPRTSAQVETVPQSVVSGGVSICQHPEKFRKQIKSMGSVEHWMCDPLQGGCGYEHRR